MGSGRLGREWGLGQRPLPGRAEGRGGGNLETRRGEDLQGEFSGLSPKTSSGGAGPRGAAWCSLPAPRPAVPTVLDSMSSGPAGTPGPSPGGQARVWAESPREKEAKVGGSLHPLRPLGAPWEPGGSPVPGGGAGTVSTGSWWGRAPLPGAGRDGRATHPAPRTAQAVSPPCPPPVPTAALLKVRLREERPSDGWRGRGGQEVRYLLDRVKVGAFLVSLPRSPRC